MCAAKFFWFVLYQFLTLLLFTYYGKPPVPSYIRLRQALAAYVQTESCNGFPTEHTHLLCPWYREADGRDDMPAGMMAVAVSPSVQLAAVISSAFYSVWFLFTGGLLHA